MEPREEGAKAGGPRALALAAAVAGAAWLLAWIARFDFVADDAYISFRYARHLARGAGLRFNLGEDPPVEGYSNLAWVLWCALAELARVDVTLWARASGAACALTALFLAARLAWRRAGMAAGGWAALLLGSWPGFGLWASGGLETAAFTLALTALAFALGDRQDRPHPVLATSALLAALALRTDGAVWVAALLGLHHLVGEGAPRARLQGLKPSLLALALGLAALLAFRLAYHRDWISGTARVKGGLSALRLERGLSYVASQLCAQPALLVALALVVAGALAARGPTRALARTGLGLFAFALAYALLVGGDFMALGRLLVPALPSLAAGAGAVLAALGARRALPAALVGVTALALALGAGFDRLPFPRAALARLHFRWNSPRWESELSMWRGMRERSEHWALLGRALALHTRAEESILGWAIGAMSYPNELHVHDLFGLVSPEVARLPLPHRRMSPGHDRFVGPEFFFGRKPTYYGAALAAVDAPRSEGLGSDFEQTDLSRVIEIERYPLPAEEGFPPGHELRLFRMRW